KLGELRHLHEMFRIHHRFFAGDYIVYQWLGATLEGVNSEIANLRPGNELELFFGLRALMRKQGKRLTPLLEELPMVPGPFARQFADWQMQSEITGWRVRLDRVPSHIDVQRPSRRELRFRLDPDALVPEVREEGGDWRTLKASEFDPFSKSSALSLTKDEMLLWQSFREIVRMHSKAYAEEHCGLHDWLGAQLRHESLRVHFVDEVGMPLVIHAQPLRWRVMEPNDGEPRYRFSLVDAEDRSAGMILSQFAGIPTLYLTSSGLFEGPDIHSGEFASETELSVPAAALETRGGLRFLESLGVGIPEQIKKRMVTVVLRPRIEGSLHNRHGTTSERCSLFVSATGDDGNHLHRLGDVSWFESAGAVGTGLIRFDFRNLESLRRLLDESGFECSPYNGSFEMRVTKAFPGRFRAFLDRLPPMTDLRLEPPLDSIRDGVVAGSVELEVEEKEVDWFDLKVVLKTEDTSLTAEELSLLLGAKGEWVDLKGRGWRRLKFNLTDQQEEDLARIGLTARELSAEPQRLHALQLATPSVRKFLPDQTATRVERRAAELKARVTPGLPAGIQAELRPYQVEGFHFLAYLVANGFGGILADDMGLGKTVQTLTWLAWLRVDGARPDQRNWPSLVVCPKSVQDNWRSEAARFYPELRVRVWGPDTLKREDSFTGADLHILNYAQLRAMEDRLQRVRFLAAILDEGQNIKNPSSQSAQVARSLQASHRLVLTGTPIENRLMDLWSLMAFAMPGVLGPRSGFGRLYDAKGDPWARTRLAARLRPFLLRRTKSQVARDLPDRQEEDLYCDMEGEQRTLYLAELKVARRILLKLKTPEALNRERFHLLTSLLRLRQICCHPRLHRPESQSAGAKLEALLETLEPLVEQEEKVLVFSQFVELLGFLKDDFAERNWTHWYLDGQTEKRGDLVRDFQEREGGGVFLISLKAGGSGLNLTAASYVVLFDPWWNPAVENQAIDRTHRIGQTRKILAYRFLIKDSIEEKIRQLQRTKSSLAAEVLGEERFSEALTLDDLRFLLAEPDGKG
ncbi:MAG: DEAD/DEAH box helicase, partial [Verrucomicrobiota bacterium]